MEYTNRDAKHFLCPLKAECIGGKCALWVSDPSHGYFGIRLEDLKLVKRKKKFLWFSLNITHYDYEDKEYYQALLDRKYGVYATIFDHVSNFKNHHVGAIIYFTIPKNERLGHCGLIRGKG